MKNLLVFLSLLTVFFLSCSGEKSTFSEKQDDEDFSNVNSPDDDSEEKETEEVESVMFKPKEFFGLITDKGYLLRWSKPSEEPVRWQIHRKNPDEDNYTKIVDLDSSKNEYTDTSFSQTTRSSYKLVALGEIEPIDAGIVDSSLPTWTLIRFMNLDSHWGDNFPTMDNAKYQATMDLAEAALNPNIQVAVLVDAGTPNGSIWINTDPDEIHVTKEKPEIDFGNVDELKSFVDWATKEFPAQRYALSFWGHGSGPLGGQDYNTARAILPDETDSNDLSPEESGELLDYIIEKTGKTVEVTFFCTCLTQNVETAYPLINKTRYTVAGESVVGCGKDIVEVLVDNIHSFAEETAIKTCEAQKEGYDIDVLFSAIHNEVLGELGRAMGELTDSLIQLMKSDNSIRDRIMDLTSEVQNMKYSDGVPDFTSAYLDIYDLMEHLGKINDSTIKQKTAKIKTIIKEKVVKKTVSRKTEKDLYRNAHGISVYHPTKSFNYYSTGYNKRIFSKDTGWGDYLKELRKIDIR